MPEYLAPGVYVEETSFRAKSIEGVSTSTTAFVGPTRKGPVAADPDVLKGKAAGPEVLTSFGDFERIYGGLDDLALPCGRNYLAHAVRNYFDNGGSILYVARVFLAGNTSGKAASAPVVQGDTPAGQARFVARFPGAAGNGRITLRQAEAPATVRSMATAPEGSILRVGGKTPALPARIDAGIPPFSVAPDSILTLRVKGADMPISFHGKPAEATSSDPLPDPVPLTTDNNTLRVVVDRVPQTITLPTGNVARAALVTAIQGGMQRGYARLTADGHLVIGSDRKGSAASVTVSANPALHFNADTAASNAPDPATNNVADLAHVTADEISTLLMTAKVPARAVLLPSTGRMALSTTDTGSAATLEVRDGASTAYVPLGLRPSQPAPGADGSAVNYYVKTSGNWVDPGGNLLDTSKWPPAGSPPEGADLLTLSAVAEDAAGAQVLYDGMGFDPAHPRWIGNVLAAQPTTRGDALQNLYALEIGQAVKAHDLRQGLFAVSNERVVSLTGGDDGVEPTQKAYQDALAELLKLEDVSIVAGPGHSAYADYQGIQGALIGHAETRRAYRIAVLDAPPRMTPSQVREARGQIDSSHAAFYYPWVVVSNPLYKPGLDNVPREITLPPSGFVCGIYARSDDQRGVFKAPANEVVLGALRFETDVNFAQQEVLNPVGVNCLRYLTGRGYRLWGARTASSDPDWKYVNIRRYFLYLESSIDQGTQWAVFEPNGERLWATIRETISSFLYNEWVSGALLGASAEEAYFVRCDRSTMTQNDLDNGRLICLVGVAAIKPAEFVIFRIGQATAGARS